MVKYILYIDFMSGVDPVGYKYIPLESDNLISAIDEADKVFDGGRHYLIRILEKSGKVTVVDGCRVVPFTAVLCRRSYGWHGNTADNYEDTHTIDYHYNRDGIWWTENTLFTSQRK